jgi:ResB-like family
MLDRFLSGLIRTFSSLKLTVVCLTLGMLLVFFGTLAQVDLGLYRAQNEFFRSFIASWGPPGGTWKIFFPGGYLIGGVLLINLIAAFVTRFTLEKRKIGIFIIHAGIILLLMGQLLTDMLSRESAMQLFEGETKNYSEDFRANELVLIDKSDPKSDLVYSIPDSFLARPEIHDPRLPFVLKVKKYWPNASLFQAGPDAPPMAFASGANAGELKDVLVLPVPASKDADSRSTPGAVVELEQGQHALGSFLVSPLANRNQLFRVGDKTYEIALRGLRYYYPFSLTLLKATHEKYKGTDIPRNFASQVQVQNADRGESRKTDIYMNNPLRYGGLTFYQYQMAAGDMAERQGAPPSSTLQVVRNPSWLTPYLSCVLISLGLIVQFGSHLTGFVRRKAI